MLKTIIENKIILYFFLILIAALFLAILSRILKNKKRGASKARGSKGGKGSLSRKSKGHEEGIIFGIDSMGRRVFSKTKDEGHVAVFGGSGIGKTSAILIPTLRRWKGTFLAIDISGDIQKNVVRENCITYDPLDKATIPFNVFAAIDAIEGVDEKNEALSQLALLIMPDSFKMSETQKFFTVNGRKILTAMLIACYHAGLDFVPICELIVENDHSKLFDLILDSHNRDAARYITGFKGANAKNTAGCKQAVDEKISLFATNAMIKHSIRRPLPHEAAFSCATLEEASVFVKIPDDKLKLYSPLLGLITAMSLEFLSQRQNAKNPKILLALDEFASLGHLSILEALRKLRKKNVRIMMLTQSVPDIDLEYGQEERKSMMNNYKYKVVLEASDPDTQDYFAKLIGYKEEKKYSYSTGSTSSSTTESKERRWAIEPSALAALGDNLILLHEAGYMVLKKNFYYKYDK